MPSRFFPRTQFHASPEALVEMERADMDKLSNIVKDAISSASQQTGLTEDDVMIVLGKLQVEMLGQMKGHLDMLMAQGEIERVDTRRLSNALESAIRSIAEATDLATAQITEIFVIEKWSNVDSIVESLRIMSRADRADQV